MLAAVALLSLCVQGPPLNGTCDAAAGLTTMVPVQVSLFGGTTSGFGAAALAGGVIERDVFFEFYPPVDGGYVFLFEALGMPQRIAAYDSPGCSGSLIAEGEPSTSVGTNRGGIIRLNGLSAGQPILLQLGTQNAQSQGGGKLLIYGADFAGGPSCDNAPLLPGPGAYSFPLVDNPVINQVGGPACAPSGISGADRAFFRFVVPADGDYRFSTEASPAVNPIAVYGGIDCGADCIVSGDDAAVIVPELTAGTALLVSVGVEPPFLTGIGALGTLAINPLEKIQGDTCMDPIPLTSFVPSRLPASGATVSGLPSFSCDPNAGPLFRDMFFSFTSPAETPFEVRATLGEFFGATPSEIRLFEGAACDGQCLDRAPGNGGFVTIPASARGSPFRWGLRRASAWWISSD